jgi:hypothetical protein
MATWGQILHELKTAMASGAAAPGVSPFDWVRRKYLAALAKETGRNVVLYATRWTQPPIQEPELVSITPEDVQGFMEAVHGLPVSDGLDLVLHSPGGSPEATEALVVYLRSHFKNIRVIIPHAAMSAATMVACAADRIVMGTHSFLGPIDPQFILQTEVGRAAVPAHAILEQFELAKKECKDTSLLPSWLPILRQYGPALVVQCQLAQSLSQSLVAEWLARYMFAYHTDGATRADTTAKALADHASFKSHGRFIGRDQARTLGLIVDDLESAAGVEDAVLSAFHATTHTFNATPAVKIIENHQGKAFIKAQQVLQVQVPAPFQGPPPVVPAVPKQP